MEKMILPIDAKKEEIKSAVMNSRVVIIEAETGAGKSLRVPQMIAELGFDVCITEPRRIAAVTLASREAEELECEVGKEVGYATGFEKCYDNNTNILFCTDGLQLVREINSRAVSKPKVLIIDEVHEWNLNVETLVAWAKLKIEEDDSWNTKVVIMSATMEANKLAAYFGKATIVSVEGKTFPVSYRKSALSVEAEAAKMAKKGKNTLVFLPGKREIEETIMNLKDRIGDIAVLLPLHGELSMEEQRRCFKAYNKPIIVCATNIAQTSLTIPGIDAVVDSGQQKILMSKNGIEALIISECSQADILQRQGRAGRVKEGEYVLCCGNDIDKREPYTTPEILRLNLEQIVLRLAAVGIDASTLKFFHQPPKENILRAKNVLINLGAMDTSWKVTEIGKQMACYPIGVRGARMLVEAEKLGVLEDLIIITAILNNGSLVDWSKPFASYKNFTKEEQSDLLAERDIWNSIKGRYVNFKEEKINSKAYFRVKDYIEKLTNLLGDKLNTSKTENSDRKSVIVSCISGMVDLMHQATYHMFNGPDGISRYHDKKSCVSHYMDDYVVGFPKVIEYEGRWGIREKLYILSTMTKVDVEDVKKFAPNLFTKVFDGDIVYSKETGKCYTHYTENYFNLVVFYGADAINDTEIIAREKEKYEENQRQIEENERREREIRAEIEAKFRYDIKRYNDIQRQIEVEGKTYGISYIWSAPNIFMDIEDIFSVSVKEIRTQKGEVVTINCNKYSISSNNIPALKSMLETDIMKEKLSSLKDSLGTKSIKNYDDFVSALTMLGNERIKGIEIEKEFIKCLSVKNDKIVFDVVESAEEAKVNNDEAIRLFFGKEIEKRFSMKPFFFVIDGKRTLTNKGSKAKNHFEDEKREVIKQICPSNFEESIEYLEIVYEESVGMLN